MGSRNCIPLPYLAIRLPSATKLGLAHKAPLKTAVLAIKQQSMASTKRTIKVPSKKPQLCDDSFFSTKPHLKAWPADKAPFITWLADK